MHRKVNKQKKIWFWVRESKVLHIWERKTSLIYVASKLVIISSWWCEEKGKTLKVCFHKMKLGKRISLKVIPFNILLNMHPLFLSDLHTLTH